MLDRHHLIRITATMLRHGLATYPSASEYAAGLAGDGWRTADRHQLADTLAGQVIAGCAHLHDLHVTRQAVDALRQTRIRATGRTAHPTPLRRLPPPRSTDRARMALHAHASACTGAAALPWLAGRLIADVLHLLLEESQDPNRVVLAALDTVLAETPPADRRRYPH